MDNKEKSNSYLFCSEEMRKMDSGDRKTEETMENEGWGKVD